MSYGILWLLPKAKQLNSIFVVVYAIAVAIQIIHLLCVLNFVVDIFMFFFSNSFFFSDLQCSPALIVFFVYELNSHFDHSLFFPLSLSFRASLQCFFCLCVCPQINSPVRVRADLWNTIFTWSSTHFDFILCIFYMFFVLWFFSVLHSEFNDL